MTDERINSEQVNQASELTNKKIYPISILLSYNSLTKLISGNLQEIDVPKLGKLELNNFQIYGGTKAVELSITTKGFFDGKISMMGSLIFEESSRDIIFKVDELDLDTDSFLQRMGASMTKPILYKLLSEKLKINESEIERLMNEQFKNGMGDVFNKMDIKADIEARKLKIYDLFSDAKGLHLNAEISLKLELI